MRVMARRRPRPRRPRASSGLPALARCRTDGGLQRAVVDTDVLSVEARAAIGTVVDQAQPAPGQVLELHLLPRADDEVVTRVLTRAAAHDQDRKSTRLN